MNQIVIASRLSDGRVVFFAPEFASGKPAWKELIADAAMAEDDARAAELLAQAEADSAQANLVFDAYLIDIEESNGARRPTKYREAIRALGPSIRLDLGKQAEGSEA